MAANVARTATYGLTNALLPFLTEIVQKGTHKAIYENAGLRAGLCTYEGKCTKEMFRRVFEMEPSSVESMIFSEKSE